MERLREGLKKRIENIITITEPSETNNKIMLAFLAKKSSIESYNDLNLDFVNNLREILKQDHILNCHKLLFNQQLDSLEQEILEGKQFDSGIDNNKLKTLNNIAKKISFLDKKLNTIDGVKSTKIEELKSLKD